MHRPKQIDGVPIPYEAPIELLVESLRGNSPDAWAAFAALGADSTQQSLRILLAEMRSPDPFYRRAAVEAVASHKLGAQAAEAVVLCLCDDSEFVVRSACDTVATLMINSAHDSVLLLLMNKDPNTRVAAIRALAKIWKPVDFVPVFERARGDSVPDDRKQAAWALYENVDSAHWKTLFATWVNDGLARHRIWACEIATRFGGEDEVTSLKTLCADPNGHVRKAAAKSIEKMEARRSPNGS